MPWDPPSTKTVRIDLPDAGEWVDVKERLSVGDQRLIKKAMVKSYHLTMDGESELDSGEMYDAADFATLDVAIVGWSNKKLPVTPRNIRAMSDEMVECIKVRLSELYPVERTDEEKNASSESTPLLSIIKDITPTDSGG